MTPFARQTIEQVSAEFGLDPRQINASKHARGNVVAARIEIAKRLCVSGYSTTQIGRVLGRDHSTIVFYLGHKASSSPVSLRWRTPRIRHLACRGCRHCYFPAVEVVPSPPEPRPRKVRRYLIPYAGADMQEYQWKERAP